MSSTQSSLLENVNLDFRLYHGLKNVMATTERELDLVKRELALSREEALYSRKKCRLYESILPKDCCKQIVSLQSETQQKLNKALVFIRSIVAS